jgi:hypothetical protein
LTLLLLAVAAQVFGQTATVNVNTTTKVTQPPVGVLTLDGAASFMITRGSGSPNSVVTASTGSMYLDQTGALWFKQTGTGNTGWSQLGTGTGAVSSVFGRTGSVVAATGDYSFPLISGTLGATQFPALTGDVTTTAGSVATTISANAVTYPKMQAASVASKLIGSPSTGTTLGEITLGTNLSMSGSTLNSTAGGGGVTSFATGNLPPIFTAAPSTATTGAIAETFTLSTAAAHNFLGNNTASTAAPAYVQPAFSDLSGTISTAQDPIFVASGASHAPGAVPDPGATAGTTHFLREDATWVVPGGGGNVSNVGTPTNGQLAQWTGATTIQGINTLPAARFPALTGDVTTASGSVATTISANAVTYAKMQAASTASLLIGVSDKGTALGEITLGTNLSISGSVLNATAGGGGVSTFATGNLAPIFTAAPSTPTAGGISQTFTLSTAAAHNFLGNNTATTAAPAYVQPAFSDLSGNIATTQMNSGTGASSSSFWRGDGTWAVPAGGGNVSNVGTPTANQIAQWTSATTIQGISTIGNSLLANSTITLNAGTNTGLTTPGAMSLGSINTIGATTDNLQFNALGLAAVAPTTGGLISTQLKANNVTGLTIKRFTDTSPTGNFEAFQSTAGATLWNVDITGTLTAGSLPIARLSASSITIGNAGAISLGGSATLDQITGFSSAGIIKRTAANTYAAAVAKTDYWDTTDMVASGASGAHGLVPTPGTTAGATRFLREDATWVVPGGGGNVSNVGTPTNLQIAQWTGATTIQGLSTTGTGNAVLATSPTITTPSIAALSNLTTNGFVKTGGGVGTLSVDTTAYGTGTVTSFSSGNLSPLFTTAVGAATTTPALSFALSNTSAGHQFFGNNTAAAAAPAYVQPAFTDLAGFAATTQAGLPIGGTTGQTLQKNSATNYDTGWITPVTSSQAIWNYKNVVTMADPAATNIRVNNALFGSATAMAISVTSMNNVDRTNLLLSIQVGDIIEVQDQTSAANWARYNVSGAPVNNTTWFQIPVAFVTGSGSNPANNDNLLLTFNTSGGGGGAGVVSSVFGRTGAVVATSGDYSFSLLSGTAAVSQLPLMIASGASHAAGIAPDPGATAGTTHFLREDATWAVPSGGAGGAPGGATTLLQYNNAGAFGGVLNASSDGTNVTIWGMKFIQGPNVSGGWIDMPTTGPSGLGSGGSGVNPWVAYASAGGNYFSNAAIGDIIYRNTGGKLLFGTTSTIPVMVIPASSSTSLRLNSTAVLGFTSGDPAATVVDTGIGRNAAGVVEIDNGTLGTFADFEARNLTSSWGVKILQGPVSSGGWIDMPTTGPSGIGTGGAGSNVWLGYVSTVGNYYNGTAIGDMVVRNATGNKIFFGINQATPNATFNLGASQTMNFANNAIIGWSSGADTTAAVDTGLKRNAVGVLEVDTGVAGTFADLKLRNLTVSGTCIGCGGAAPGGSHITATVDQTSAAETVHPVYTVPANSAAVGTTYRIDVFGNVDVAATILNYTIRLRWGGVTGTQLLTLTPAFTTVLAPSSTNNAWRLSGLVTVRTTGTTGTVFANLTWTDAGQEILSSTSGTTGITVDTTTAKDLVMTAATTGATQHFRTLGGGIEVVPP